MASLDIPYHYNALWQILGDTLFLFTLTHIHVQFVLSILSVSLNMVTQWGYIHC